MSNARNLARLLPNASGVIPEASLPQFSGSKLNSPVDYSILPYGSVLQVKSTNAVYNWGSVGNSNTWDLSFIDVTLTTKLANSAFYIAAQYSVDDTNSAAFGVGLGSKYSTNGGSTWTEIRTPAYHEDYNSGGVDKYYVSKMAFTYALSIPANTSIIFRVTSRFNNSNGQFFNGNGQQFCQMQTVMEIRNV